VGDVFFKARQVNFELAPPVGGGFKGRHDKNINTTGLKGLAQIGH
jgi:hypothetical protein